MSKRLCFYDMNAVSALSKLLTDPDEGGREYVTNALALIQGRKDEDEP